FVSLLNRECASSLLKPERPCCSSGTPLLPWRMARICQSLRGDRVLLRRRRWGLIRYVRKHSSPTVRISINEQCTLAGRNCLLRPVRVGALPPPNMYGAIFRLICSTKTVSTKEG